MTKRDVKTLLDRVLTWPRERQEDVVQVLIGMESQDKSELHLTEGQAEEIRHRLAKTNRITVTFEDAFKRFHSRGV